VPVARAFAAGGPAGPADDPSATSRETPCPMNCAGGLEGYLDPSTGQGEPFAGRHGLAESEIEPSW
jgi:hypothetical protein